MARPERANGAGAVYIKHGSYYGRWVTPSGRTNRRLGPVRRPGSSVGMTRTQAEKRLRALMAEAAVPVVSDPARTVEVAGPAANPCKLVDPPEVQPSADIRFLMQAELMAVLEGGIPEDAMAVIERSLYLMAAMTGLRQGELLGLRWVDLDSSARKVRVRQAWVRGEFKSPKSRRGSRGVPMAEDLALALEELARRSTFTAGDDLVFAHPQTGKPLDRSRVRKGFQRACRRADVRVVRFHDLRHTFAKRIAASGEVSLRTLQEWMGHRDAKTTPIYADYQPGERESEIVSRASRRRSNCATWAPTSARSRPASLKSSGSAARCAAPATSTTTSPPRSTPPD